MPQYAVYLIESTADELASLEELPAHEAAAQRMNNKIRAYHQIDQVDAKK